MNLSVKAEERIAALFDRMFISNSLQKGVPRGICAAAGASVVFVEKGNWQ